MRHHHSPRGHCLAPIAQTARDQHAEELRREDRRRNAEAKVFFTMAILVIVAVVIFA